jgi:Ala-tRNA(Pro) deacylase
MRIAQFLAEQQVPFETILHPPAFTAQKRAKFLRVSGRRVAKAVLLAGPDGHVLAVLPATHQIDTDGLSRELQGPVRLATGPEIAEVFRDCEWGVIVPFGALYGLTTLLDESLKPEDVIVFEGHTHGQAIRMQCGDFERLERPRRLSFAHRFGAPCLAD